MYCHHCNRKITARGDVCPECGTPLELCAGNSRECPATDPRLKNLLEEVTRSLDETFAPPGVELDAAETRDLQADTSPDAEQAERDQKIFEDFDLEKTRETPGAPQPSPENAPGPRAETGSPARGRTVALCAGVAVMFCLGAALQSSGLLSHALRAADPDRATAPHRVTRPAMPAARPAPDVSQRRPGPPRRREVACYAVHTDSYRSRRSAEQEAAALRDQGFAAYLDNAEVPDSGRWFRVKVGPFATAAEARIAMNSLQARAGKNDALIVPERFREPPAAENSPDLAP